MTPTIIGIAFLVVSCYFFTRGTSALLGLLIFSGIFQAATVVSTTSAGLQPYYCVAVFFLARCGIEATLGKFTWRTFRGIRPLLLFIVLGVCSACILPFVFHGIPVNNPELRNPEMPLTPVPLQFTSGNLIQAGLLVINGLVVMAAGLIPGQLEPARRGLMAAFYTLAIILAIQWACLLSGVPFPYSIVNNNQHYNLANAMAGGGYLRPNGTFTEPSMAGALLAGMALALLVRFLESEEGQLAMITAFACLLMVASSASFVAVGVGLCLVLAQYPVVRFPWYLRLHRLKRMRVLLAICVVIAAALAVPVLRRIIVEQTLNKGDSFSLLVRMTQDLTALHVVYESYGVGVGLGSNRPASLIPSLLSTVGVAGLALFILMILSFFRNPLGRNSWLKWVCTGLVLDMATGIPDLSFPLLWITLALLARAAQTGVGTPRLDENMSSVPVA